MMTATEPYIVPEHQLLAQLSLFHTRMRPRTHQKVTAVLAGDSLWAVSPGRIVDDERLAKAEKGD